MRSSPERVLLLVDLKNQIYKASASHATLFSGRTFTGGLYGFLVSVCAAIRDTNATSIAVATDTGPYVRRDEFAGYKGDRKVAQDEVLLMKATSSIKLTEEFLEQALRCPVWAVRGFEYDDIAAWAASTYSGRFDRVIAYTNDSDLYQLFDIPNFSVYRNVKKGIYGLAEFRSEYGDLTRHDWITFLSMTGTHNAVPGINGIGPVGAKKALADPILMRSIKAKHARLLTRNRGLITLPHPAFPEDPGLRLQRHKFEMSDVSRFCSRYDINLTSNIVGAFQDIRHI